MKRKKYFCVCIAVLLTIFQMTTLTGCKKNSRMQSVSDDISFENNDSVTLSEQDVIEQDVIDQDKVIHINTTEELLEAVKPGANIFVESGYYNMSDYIEGLWNEKFPCGAEKSSTVPGRAITT